MEKRMECKCRESWIDVYKGIAILFVIIGHLEISNITYRTIYLFHMYAFFFISGITLKQTDRKLSVIIKENIRKLYIPYCFFAFLWDMTNKVIQLYYGNELDLSILGVIKNIIAILLGWENISSSASIGPAWFLMALLVVRICYHLINKLCKNNVVVVGIVCLFLYVCGYLCEGKDTLPFKLVSTFTTFIFVYLGYVGREIIEIMKKYSIWRILLIMVLSFGTLCLISFLLVEKNLLLVNNILPQNPIITLIGSLSGILSIICGSLILEKATILESIFSYYGKNSMIVMGIHSEIRMMCYLVLKTMNIRGGNACF